MKKIKLPPGTYMVSIVKMKRSKDKSITIMVVKNRHGNTKEELTLTNKD